jgi:hypothetical protein
MIIYLDGLERSGNVYLTYALGCCFEKEIRSTRSHSVKTLKNHRISDPFIVPVRDAVDSIASAKVFRDYIFENQITEDAYGMNSELDKIISRYQNYIEYLVDSPQFFIAPFHKFIDDHNAVVDKIIKFYPDHEFLKNKKITTKEEIFSQVELKIKSNIYKNAYHPQIGNFPREDNEKKHQVKSLLLTKYNKEIESIQEKIEILYQRYDDI